MKSKWSEKALAARRKKYADDPEYRAHTLRYGALRRYKMTPEEFDAQLKEQGGHCALCPNVAGKKSLHVDHDHTCCTKKFTCGKCRRGILCSVCNIKLGALEDILYESYTYPVPYDNSWLEKTLAYLKKWYEIHQSSKTQEEPYGQTQA